MKKSKADTGEIAMNLTVGKVAARSGVSIFTIHFYESKGLIKGWRTTGNQRRYPREVLRRIAVIKAAQRVGIPLDAIRQTLASLPKGRTPNVEDWAALSARWKADLDDRIARLTQLRDALSSCIGCGCLSLSACPLSNRGDKLSKEGPGARLLEPR